MPTANRAAQLSLRGDTRQAVTSLKRVEQAQRGLGRSFDKTAASTARANRAMLAMNKEAGRLKGAMAGRLGLAGGILGVAVALDQFADRAVEVNNVYKTLKISVDEASVAVTGQVDKLTLAKNANKLHLAGVKLTSKEYATMAGVIAKASDATGQDLAANLDKATKALANGNVERLASMGLTLDQRTAEREYAESLGKSVAELTKVEKQQIAVNLLMTEGVQQTDAMGAATANAAVRWVQLKNAFRDALDQLIFIDKNFREFAHTLETSVQGALMDLGVSAQNVEKIFARFHNLQDAKWALFTGNVKRARIEMMALAGVVSTTELAGLRAQQFVEEKAQRDAAAAAEKQALALQETAKANPDSGAPDKPTGGGRRGGRSRGKPSVIASNQDPVLGAGGIEAAVAFQAGENSAEVERQRQEDLEEIRAEAHERRKERHEQAMRMLEEQQAAQEAHRQSIINWAETAVSSFGNMGEALVNLTALTGASGKKQQQIAAVVEGGVLIAKAVSHQVQAAMAFASWNVPLGIAHQTAAFAGFTNAAVFMSGRVPGGGGRGGGRGGGGRGSPAGGITQQLPAANSSRADSPIPLSSNDRQFGATSAANSAPQNQTVVFNGPVFDTKASVGRAIEQYRREFKQAGGSF